MDVIPEDCGASSSHHNSPHLQAIHSSHDPFAHSPVISSDIPLSSEHLSAPNQVWASSASPHQSRFDDPIYASSSSSSSASLTRPAPRAHNISSTSSRPTTPPPGPYLRAQDDSIDIDRMTPPPPDLLATAGQIPLPISPSARRIRVTMGPRADCEKCRLRVPGHWMHMVE